MGHDNQQEYYQAINASSAANNCGFFIDFMLKEILTTLKMHTAGAVNGGVSGGVNPILDFIIQYPGCRANVIAEKLNMPLRTVQRRISELKKENKIEFKGAPKSGGYFVRNHK